MFAAVMSEEERQWYTQHMRTEHSPIDTQICVVSEQEYGVISSF